MRFIHRLIRTLILPNNAGPGDPQIRIGPDVPSCMQAEYTAVILFMPPGWNAGIGAPPSHYFGQRENLSSGASVVDYGIVEWDEDTVCGWVALESWKTEPPDAGTGEVDVTKSIGGSLASPGSGGSGVTYGAQSIFIGPSGTTPLPSPLSQTVLSGLVDINLELDGGNSNNDLRCADINASVISMPRGRRFFYSRSDNSPTANPGPTAVLNNGPTAFTARAGRAYEVILRGTVDLSTTANMAGFILSGDSGGGAVQKAIFAWIGPEATATFTPVINDSVVLINATAADISFTLSMTLQASSGSVIWKGEALRHRELEIRDIGAAADYSTAASW